MGAAVPEGEGSGDAEVVIKIANRPAFHDQVPDGPVAGKGLGRSTVETENGPTVFSGSIRFLLPKEGGEQVAEMDYRQIVADKLDAIDEMDLTGFGEREDQEALRSVLRE
jgi:hypothetical protein